MTKNELSHEFGRKMLKITVYFVVKRDFCQNISTRVERLFTLVFNYHFTISGPRLLGCQLNYPSVPAAAEIITNPKSSENMHSRLFQLLSKNPNG